MTMRGLAWLGMAAVVSMMCVGCTSVQQRLELDEVRHGPPFPRIANCYGARINPHTPVETLDFLAQYDLLIGYGWCDWENPAHRAALEKKLAYLKQKNPHIMVLDFSSSAPYVAKWEKPETFPKDGWLLSPEGERINGWPGSKMVNLTKPEALEWFVARSHRSVHDRPLDGTFIDCMGGQFDWWACEIATGRPYEVDADEDGKADRRGKLDKTWRDAKEKLARQVRERIGPESIFMANQAERECFGVLNGILLEDYLDYVLDKDWDWQDVLEDYLHWTNTPHRPTVTTIVSSSGIVPPFNPHQSMTDAERAAMLAEAYETRQRMRFGLATTLMGNGYFAYDVNTRWRGQHWWYAEYDAPLGYPTGSARQYPDGTWRRRFDGGTVVVNPTHFDVEVQTKRRRRDASSGRVGRSFVIPAQNGRILIYTVDNDRPPTMSDPRPLLTRSGAETLAVRGDVVLWRLRPGITAVFRTDGKLLALDLDGKVIIGQVWPLMVSPGAWRDFEAAQVSYAAGENGGLLFTGRRIEDDRAVAYELEVKPDGDALHFSYDFEALTDLHLRAFRLQVDLPPRLFIGARAAYDGRQIDLPAEPQGAPLLRGRFKSVTLWPKTGPHQVRITTSGPCALLDERVYKTAAFRVVQNLAGGSVKAGTRWHVEITIELEP